VDFYHCFLMGALFCLFWFYRSEARGWRVALDEKAGHVRRLEVLVDQLTEDRDAAIATSVQADGRLNESRRRVGELEGHLVESRAEVEKLRSGGSF